MMPSSSDLTLIIDTSFKGVCTTLANWSDGNCDVISWQHQLANQVAAARLTKIITDQLQKSDATLRDVGRVVVAQGPGTFTGIKVGLAFAEGLTAGLAGIQKFQVSSLEALARHQPGCWLLPATKTQGYLATNIDGKPLILIVDYSGDIRLYQEGSRQPLDLGLLESNPIHLLLPWPAIEQHLKTAGIPYLVSTEIVSSSLILAAIIGHLESGKPQPCSVFEPRYVRKSAPEELLVKKISESQNA